ncbi:MAG: type II toxin-antitoxin system RelE/ParE family toxin [Candidatus Margulisbacteria bacterium]|nr:type II toxin-antitoxin system RelE/ParE family toxin [Candidatus Margulisiibacteriota bacterium]
MLYNIVWTEKAVNEYTKLDKSVKNQIGKYLDKLKISDNPHSMGRPLSANLAGLWRYRVGDYRIVVEIKNFELIILIVSIKHRSIVYRQI